MMDDAAKLAEPTTIARVTLTVTRGVTAGWVAGISQVLVAQAVSGLLGMRERGDIAPRFIERAAEHAGRPLSKPMHWLLGGVFHFEYAAGWGAGYATAAEAIGPRRLPPLLGGAVLGGLIYTAAFSRLGAGTRTGAESEPEQRSVAETLVHCSAAWSFALTMSYAYRWLRERW